MRRDAALYELPQPRKKGHANGNYILADGTNSTVTLLELWIGYNRSNDNLLRVRSGAVIDIGTVGSGQDNTANGSLRVGTGSTTGNGVWVGDLTGAASPGTLNVTNAAHNAMLRIFNGSTMSVGAGSTLNVDVLQMDTGAAFGTGNTNSAVFRRPMDRMPVL